VGRQVQHVSSFPYFLFLLLLLSASVIKPASTTAAQKSGTSASPGIAETYFVPCDGENKTNHVTGAVSVYGEWQAYVEVSVQAGCLYTTRLWVATQRREYQLIYLMPPERDNTMNGMKILGWAPGSRMILVQTERTANGTDAGPTESLVAMDVKTGEVFQPDLSVVLKNRKPRCSFEITGGGFDSDPNVILLARVRLFSFFEPDETESDVPAQDRCVAGEETWSFNYANGEVKRVDNSRPLHVAADPGLAMTSKSQRPKSR
jgi:hypothetical protein